MGLFDREVIGDCGALRSPDKAAPCTVSPEEWREVYEKEKIYGFTHSELEAYLIPRRGQIIDPYYGGEDTLH
jgi:hypothetical protein